MKKFFTLLMALASFAGVQATDYTDSLAIYVGGSPTAIVTPATISVTQNDKGSYNFLLRNFAFGDGTGNVMKVGNIQLNEVPAQAVSNGRTLLAKHDLIKITAGDTGAAEEWLGSMLGDVDINLSGYLVEGRAYAQMSINVGGLPVRCVFGRGFQLLNNGFETYHKVANSDEPNAWHSFQSAEGELAFFVSGTPHTFVSTDVRPASTGKNSLLLTSTSFWTIVANGTVTTGRLNAGSADAADPANNAHLDLSSTDKDANGDPFHQLFNGQPDSIAVWVKFKQGATVAEHPYATMSAVITDGTYYQEPAPNGTTYNNVLAAAHYPTIASTNKWQRLSIPFTYTNNKVQGKAMFVTFSTNADPGQGTGTDSLWIDDVQLVYNNYVSAVSYGSTQQTVASDAKNVELTFTGTAATVSANDIKIAAAPHSIVLPVSSATVGANTEFNYLVLSDDLSSSIPVKVTVTGSTLGIKPTVATGTATPGIYTVSGQRVSTMTKGQVYILRAADGSVRKIAY